MREVPSVTIDLIKHFEGYRDHIYLDSIGKQTFGYGSLVEHYPDIIFPIDSQTAEACLQNDLKTSANAVLRLIKSPLTDNQYAALIDFVYNLGSGTLQRSTLRAQLNRQEYNNASLGFAKYVYAGKIKLAGLVRRRKAEHDLFIQ